MTAAQETASDIQHLTVRPPPFLDTTAPAWFRILEAQFQLRSIQLSTTKFYNTLAALPPEVVSKLSPEILDSAQYDKLKTAVIDFYERSKPELFANLSAATHMTGRPSLFLQELSAIASKVGVGDEFIRHKFIQALPPTISPVIAARSEMSLVQLGKLADELLPFAKATHCLQVSSKSVPHHNAPNHKSHTINIPFSIRPFKPDQRPRICRSHIYYGPKARTCRPWCLWPNKDHIPITPPSRPTSPTPSLN